MVEGRLKRLFWFLWRLGERVGVFFGGGHVRFFLMDEFRRSECGISEFFSDGERRGIFEPGTSDNLFNKDFERLGVDRLDPSRVLAAALDKGSESGRQVVG